MTNPPENGSSWPTDATGVPLARPVVEKTVIKPNQEGTMCWFWQHEYVFTGDCIVRTTRTGTILTDQSWNCRRCGKMKFTRISS